MEAMSAWAQQVTLTKSYNTPEIAQAQEMLLNSGLKLPRFGGEFRACERLINALCME